MATKRRGSIYDATMAGLYDLEETIGRGHFAVVKLARHVFTGEKVAVKVIDKIKLDPVSREHLFQEVRCMKLVQHPNIVRLYEVIDTHSKLFLILELGDYDMYEYIIKYERGVAEPEAQLYFCQIVQAISFCHKLHVVHRDLKPENVVFFEKLGMVKLTDFGFSNLFSPGQKLETSCGSLAYSAPEILLGDSYDAPAVDLWSLGVILYMLVCGRLPFQEANDSETLTKILDCSFTVPTHLSTECKQLISRMLVREPSCRASLDEIENNPWVCAGELGHAQSLPLVSRTHLTEENHQQILEQMLTGGIAAPDEVVGALERDEYNYVTATYYLLAERLLRRERLEQAQKLASQNNTAANGTENNLQLESLALSPREKRFGNSFVLCTCSDHLNENCACVQNKQRMEPANQKSATEAGQVPSRLQERICSVLQEEDEVFHRSRSRGSSPLISPSHSCSSLQQHAKVGRQSGCSSTNNSPTPQELQDELKDLSHRVSYPSWPGAATCDRSGSRSPSPLDVSGRISPVVAKYKGPVPIAGSRKLPTVSSSPHLLEICEEVEEDGEAFGGSGTLTQRSSNSSLPRSSEQTYSAVRMIRPRQAVVSPDVIRRYDRVAVICKSRRSTSCSSSEASDDDSEKKRFGLFTSRCRRDSDPDDDRNEPPSNGPGPGLNGSNGATGTNKSSHGSSTSSNQKSSSRQKHTKGSTKANSGQQMSMVSKETEKHRHLLDPRKLAYRLKKLALAPINEVPHLAPTLWIWAQSARWSSRRRMLTRSNCSMPAVEDLSITVLEKPKSCENLTGSRLLLRERAKPLANSWHVLQNSALDTSLHVFSACSCIDGLQAGCTNSAICGASTLENRTNVPKCNVTSRKYNCSDKLVNQTQSLSATCEVEQGGSFKELFRSNEKQLDGGFQCMLKHACKRKKRRKAHGIPRRCGFTDSPLNNSWISPEFNDCSGASSVSECMSCCDMLGVSLRLR